ncbi:MAG: hypothetical protein Q8L57_01470, partial [bacterium]|nr:hypothetical protein [bacterium]
MPIPIKQDYIFEGKAKILPREILLFAASLLILLFLFYAGLLYQQRLIKNDIGQFQKSIDEIDAGRDRAKERELLVFADQLGNLENVLKSRLYLSKFLEVIEKAAQPQTVYTDLSVDMERQSFEIKGQAASYGVLAKQMVKLAGAPAISSLGLTNTFVQLGGVTFTF